jgi:glyoxylase I family protein
MSAGEAPAATVERTSTAPAPTSATPTLRWSHVALNCVDPAATEDFYTRWFGFRRVRVVPLGAEEIVFLRNGEVLLELFPTSTEGTTGQADGPHTPGIARHLAFQTDDVDAVLDRMGGQVPVTLGPLGFDDFLHGWRSVWLLDPDGVVVEISQGYCDQSPDEIPGGTL